MLLAVRPSCLLYSIEEQRATLVTLTPIPTRRLRRTLAIACLAVGVAASGASGANERVAGLLAAKHVCPDGYRSDAPLAVQMRAMACLVAFARARVGVQPLRLSKKLDRVAALKVAADLECREFSHTPCGRAFMSWFAAVGYGLSSTGYAVGENLAWGRGADASPQQIMRMWLDSPGHRRNLLSPRWREFGLAVRLQTVFVGGAGAAVWANEFGKR